MAEAAPVPFYLDLVIGALVLCAVMLRSWFGAIGLPSLVAFLLLGGALRQLDARWELLEQADHAVFETLAHLGLVAILFRVGLESNLHGLLRNMRPALIIWVGNVALSFIAGYVTARYLAGVAEIPSLFVATALTATSLAVTVELWRDAGRLTTREGSLLVDVGGLDDVSAVVLVALLLVLAPILHNGDGTEFGLVLLTTCALFVAKGSAFIVACLVFSRYFERRIIKILRRFGGPGGMLGILGFGIMIAAIAAGLGFSLAIGALFAGLIFSRDPEAVRLETSFEPVYGLLAPFFFIGIGLHADIGALAPGTGMNLMLLLLAAAILGKIAGAGLPALCATSGAGALAIGVSMIPRAEIAMVVIQEGRELGEWAVSSSLFSVMVAISLVSCVITPLLVRGLLRRLPSGPD